MIIIIIIITIIITKFKFILQNYFTVNLNKNKRFYLSRRAVIYLNKNTLIDICIEGLL